MKAGFAEQALVPATEAAKLCPERWDARLLLARVWLEMRGADRALADARAAVALAKGALPEDAARDASDVIARAALMLGDKPAAEEALRATHETDPRAAVRLLALLAA